MSTLPAHLDTPGVSYACIEGVLFERWTLGPAVEPAADAAAPARAELAGPIRVPDLSAGVGGGAGVDDWVAPVPLLPALLLAASWILALVLMAAVLRRTRPRRTRQVRGRAS